MYDLQVVCFALLFGPAILLLIPDTRFFTTETFLLFVVYMIDRVYCNSYFFLPHVQCLCDISYNFQFFGTKG